MFNLKQRKDLFRLNPNKNNKNITIKCYPNDEGIYNQIFFFEQY
jgi:hypothetical protein